MALNLAWPCVNFVVYVCFANKQETATVGFNVAEGVTGEPLNLNDRDSAYWREFSQVQISDRKTRLAVVLQPLISNMLPLGSHGSARKFALKIVKRFGSTVAAGLVDDNARLCALTKVLWRQDCGSAPLPTELAEYTPLDISRHSMQQSDQSSCSDSSFESCGSDDDELKK